jgi:hypothetical protein
MACVFLGPSEQFLFCEVKIDREKLLLIFIQKVLFFMEGIKKDTNILPDPCLHKLSNTENSNPNYETNLKNNYITVSSKHEVESFEMSKSVGFYLQKLDN